MTHRFAARQGIFTVALTALLAAAGCAPQAETPATDTAADVAAEPAAPARSVHPFAAAVEEAHRSDLWRSHGAFAADVKLEFGPNTVFEGRLTTAPDGAHTRSERSSDGAVLIFDGETAWVSPAEAEWPGARFHALTWSYFLAAPHKLADPGSHLEEGPERPLGDTSHATARLTFDAGVGDAPDDWYVVYSDPESGRVAAMAYIVSFGKPLEQAEAEPHAITYSEYTDVDGVPIPLLWEFWNWNDEDGVHGDLLGRLTLSNPGFLTPDSGAFHAPEGAREEGQPTA